MLAYLNGNPAIMVDPTGLFHTDPHSPINQAGCVDWYQGALAELSKIPWYNIIERYRQYNAITAAYRACKRRVDDLPLDERPINWWRDYDTYNCAGLALRTYEFEGDKDKVKAKLSRYVAACDVDCECGESKCRLWEWVTRMYDRDSGEFVVQMDIDFHIVCSKIPGETGETGPEPRCYEKGGNGPITGPIYPIDAEPQPIDIPNVPPHLEARIEHLDQTCYCLPEGFAE